tara:strand:- start:33475 stop:34989 length:1515 start_codon:yes stop_codon:yes gene_type:complete
LAQIENKLSINKLRFIIFKFLYLISFYALGQNSEKIEILNADTTFANSNLHPNYWRLVGNISFKHNNSIMNCDSAHHFILENKIIAFGRITIKQGDNIRISGEKLIYTAKKNQANIYKNVSLKDNQITLKSEEIHYDIKNKIASYSNKSQIIDQEKTIESEIGTYITNNYKFIFKDNVIVIGNNYTIYTNLMHYNTKSKIVNLFGPSNIYSDENTIYSEKGKYDTKNKIANLSKKSFIKSKNYFLYADSINYFNNTYFGEGIENVKINDSINTFIINSDYAKYYQKNDSIKLEKKPILKIPNEQDTLFMHAKEFIKNNSKIFAYPCVKFFQNDLKGKCDSLIYNIKDSTIVMYNKPILWTDNLQITSDTIMLYQKNNSIDRMELISKPMIVEQIDSINFNQIKGKKMIGFLKKNKLKEMIVFGNGQSIFVIQDENKDKIGLNFVESSNITLKLNNNELNNVIYSKKPESTIIPMDKMKNKSRYLKEFIWRKDEEPKDKEDIFNL